jgi:hypothetical protein
MAPDRLSRAWWALLLAGPIGLVVLAYTWLAAAHGTPWLWNVVVHESGQYTLGRTILFARHFLREIPVDAAMAVALAAAVRMVTPDGVPLPRRWFVSISVLMAVGAIAASAVEEGWWEALRDLLQFRTRDDDTRYGSHWRFHLLSTIWFCSAAPVLAGISSGVAGVPRASADAGRLMRSAWVGVALLTGAFGVSAEPFTSDRYIGHQAREILTHGLITLPLVLAICVRAARGVPARQAVPAPWPLQVLNWTAVLGIPVFLVTAFGGAGLEGSAQMESGLSGVVAAHVFEHLLDYLFVLAMTLAIVSRRGRFAR